MGFRRGDLTEYDTHDTNAINAMNALIEFAGKPLLVSVEGSVYPWRETGTLDIRAALSEHVIESGEGAHMVIGWNGPAFYVVSTDVGTLPARPDYRVFSDAEEVVMRVTRSFQAYVSRVKPVSSLCRYDACCILFAEIACRSEPAHVKDCLGRLNMVVHSDLSPRVSDWWQWKAYGNNRV